MIRTRALSAPVAEYVCDTASSRLSAQSLQMVLLQR
jgi:hypothetical protein